MMDFKDYSNIPGNTVFDLTNIILDEARKIVKKKHIKDDGVEVVKKEFIMVNGIKEPLEHHITMYKNKQPTIYTLSNITNHDDLPDIRATILHELYKEEPFWGSIATGADAGEFQDSKSNNNNIVIWDSVITNKMRNRIRHRIFYKDGNNIPSVITDSELGVGDPVWPMQEELIKEYTLYDPNEEFHV